MRVTIYSKALRGIGLNVKLREGMEKLSGERGASMLETAVYLPFVLVCVFIVIVVSVVLNARSALMTGMGDALRLSATRGNTSLVGGELIAPINSYLQGAGSFGSIAPLMSFGVPPNEAAAFLNNCFTSVYGVSLGSLPAEHLYTVAYLRQALVQSIGGSVRFPCAARGRPAPTNCAALVPEPASGCIGCYLFDPAAPNAAEAVTQLSPNLIGIRCDYSPASAFIEPVVSLFRLLGLGGLAEDVLTLRVEKVFDVADIGS